MGGGYVCEIFQPPLDDAEKLILRDIDSDGIPPFAVGLATIAERLSEIRAYRDYYFGLSEQNEQITAFQTHLTLIASWLPGRKLDKSPTTLSDEAAAALKEAEQKFIDNLTLLSEYDDADVTINPPQLPRRRRAATRRT